MPGFGVGGGWWVDTVLGRELGRLAEDFGAVQTMEGLRGPTITLKAYLRSLSRTWWHTNKSAPFSSTSSMTENT